MIVLQPRPAAEEGRRLAEQACAEAARHRKPVLLAFTREIAPLDAIALYVRATLAGHDTTYWEQPSRGTVVATAGAARRIETHGAARFADAAAAWREVAAGAVTNRKDALIAFAGFAFAAAERAPHWSAFGDGALVAPALSYRATGTRADVTLATMVQPGDAVNNVAFALAPLLHAEGKTPATRRERPCVIEESGDVETWTAAVTAITDAIGSGAVDKAVLAREVTLRGEHGFDITGAIARLREGYPACTVFAFHRGGASFLGATPERLVRVEGRKVYATCLAGTAPRGSGAEEDAAAADALMRDAKERREHELVVRMIAGALTPLCREIDVPQEPAIMTMPNVQHLYTPIEGTLAAHAGVLDLVERLHPTPAVGGMPCEAALSLIARHERFDRGWYAGPIGWIDARGDGEFAVALRSALASGEEARLFAGCGIVAGSDPRREYEESAMKLRPMLGALQEQTSDIKQQMAQ